MKQKQAVLKEQLREQNIHLVAFCNIISHNLRTQLINTLILIQYIEETFDSAKQKLLVSGLNLTIENLHSTSSI